MSYKPWAVHLLVGKVWARCGRPLRPGWTVTDDPRQVTCSLCRVAMAHGGLET